MAEFFDMNYEYEYELEDTSTGFSKIILVACRIPGLFVEKCLMSFCGCE